VDTELTTNVKKDIIPLRGGLQLKGGERKNLPFTHGRFSKKKEIIQMITNRVNKRCEFFPKGVNFA
jgi:hypothetical protein